MHARAAAAEHIWKGVHCFTYFYPLAVTVSGAERTFNQLKKWEKSYLRWQGRLADLAMLSKERQFGPQRLDQWLCKQEGSTQQGPVGIERWLWIILTWCPDSLNKKNYVKQEWLDYINVQSCVSIHAKLQDLSVLCNLTDFLFIFCFILIPPWSEWRLNKGRGKSFTLCEVNPLFYIRQEARQPKK